MEIIKFQVEARDSTGKGPARRMRAQGIIPGVVYGLGQETVHLAVPETMLREILHGHAGGNVVMDLKVPGIRKKANTAAIIKEVQRDPVTRAALSIDFQWISLAESITVDVSIEVTGTAPGVEEDGGVVQVQHHQVPLSCLPTNIPDHVVAVIDGMQIGDALYARDLQAPEGATINLPEDEAILSIARPISQEELEVRVDEGLLEELVDLEAEEVPTEEAEEVEAAPAEEAEEAEEQSGGE